MQCLKVYELAPMSYGWDARWVRKRFKMGEGLEVETCQDVTTGLIACPICTDISKLCPSYGEPVHVAVSSGVTLFFSPDDLLHHMRAHARAGDWRGYTTSEEEEEELEEVEEAEEEV